MLSYVGTAARLTHVNKHIVLERGEGRGCIWFCRCLCSKNWKSDNVVHDDIPRDLPRVCVSF